MRPRKRAGGKPIDAASMDGSTRPEVRMATTHGAPALFPDLLDGVYDCVDRIVVRAYIRFIQAPGGFRL